MTGRTVSIESCERVRRGQRGSKGDEGVGDLFNGSCGGSRSKKARLVKPNGANGVGG
jgi:hypothetical protein